MRWVRSTSGAAASGRGLASVVVAVLAIAGCGGGDDGGTLGSGTTTSGTTSGTGTGTSTATGGGGAAHGGAGGVGAGGSGDGGGGGSGPGGAGHGGSGGAGGIPCVDTADCVAKLGADVCKHDLACDAKTSTCTWTKLDQDHDGHAAAACGGDDCDDANPKVHPGAPDSCNGVDDDCDGMIDDGATCMGYLTCQAGACACPPGQLCGGACVDLQTSSANCGACGNQCADGLACSGGACFCPRTTCGEACVDTGNDAAHCGACGHACPQNGVCQAGQCACPPALSLCGDACVDTSSDTSNCGVCGHACPQNGVCQAGQCACPPALTLCGDACVDTSSDASNCGACGAACAGQCTKGACVVCATVDLYVLQDGSGTMANPLANGTDRLGACRAAIDDFVADPASSGIGVGLGFHGLQLPSKPCNTNLDCNAGYTCVNGACDEVIDDCSVADYAKPIVPIVPLPGNAASIQAALGQRQADGFSTPPQALEGALSYAKSFAQANPSHTVSLVYVADGLPNMCTNIADQSELVGIAQKYAQGSPPVLTYMVAVSTDVPKAQWDTIAAAGGTGSAFVVQSAADMANALASIRHAAKKCP
jgi:hypothetical protein